MHAPSVLAQILPLQPRLAMQGHAYRVVDYQYFANNPGLHSARMLYGLGAPAAGARFTLVGGPPMVYLAEELSTAIAEVNSGNLGAAQLTAPKVHASILYMLESVLDLTDPVILNALGTTRAELIGPWRQAQRRGRIPVTQELGQAIHTAT